MRGPSRADGARRGTSPCQEPIAPRAGLQSLLSARPGTNIVVRDTGFH